MLGVKGGRSILLARGGVREYRDTSHIFQALFLGLPGGLGINPLWSIFSNIFTNHSPAKGLPCEVAFLISSSSSLSTFFTNSRCLMRSDSSGQAEYFRNQILFPQYAEEENDDPSPIFPTDHKVKDEDLTLVFTFKH